MAGDWPGDRDLLIKLEQGDETALGSILQKYWSPLVRYVARLLNDADAATDVVQESFVRLWEKASSVKANSLRPYLYRVAHNLAIDEMRRQQTRDAWRGARSTEDDGAARDPAQVLEHAELREALNGAIQSLPLRRREVFTLAYIHRLSCKEVAAIMGISPATVKNQLAAALVGLREALRGTPA